MQTQTFQSWRKWKQNRTIEMWRLEVSAERTNGMLVCRVITMKCREREREGGARADAAAWKIENNFNCFGSLLCRAIWTKYTHFAVCPIRRPRDPVSRQRKRWLTHMHWVIYEKQKYKRDEERRRQREKNKAGNHLSTCINKRVRWLRSIYAGHNLIQFVWTREWSRFIEIARSMRSYCESHAVSVGDTLAQSQYAGILARWTNTTQLCTLFSSFCCVFEISRKMKTNY